MDHEISCTDKSSIDIKPLDKNQGPIWAILYIATVQYQSIKSQHCVSIPMIIGKHGAKRKLNVADLKGDNRFSRQVRNFLSEHNVY